jgi:hypothetical protein
MAVSTFGSATLKSQVSNEEEMNCGEEQELCAQDLKNVFLVQFCLLFSPWGFPSSYWMSHRCELCFASLFFLGFSVGHYQLVVLLPIGSFTTNW